MTIKCSNKFPPDATDFVSKLPPSVETSSCSPDEVDVDEYAVERDSGETATSVRIPDEGLRARAVELTLSLNLDKLRPSSTSAWKQKSSAGNFQAYSKNDFDVVSQGFEVLTIGDIQGSAKELEYLLRTVDETRYNAVMKGLYKKKYIYGSIVHKIPPISSARSSTDDSKDTLIVKTATFAKANVFQSNEQWCYFESYRSMGQDAFVITLDSMDENDLSSGKVTKRQLLQLRGITAAYVVEPIVNSKSVRVTYHARFNGDIENGTYTASPRIVRSRLNELGRGIRELPDLVRRRRLGAQVLMNESAFQAKNTKCIVCTKSLNIFVKSGNKVRCTLCGYNVCTSCASLQNIEKSNGRITAGKVCDRCIEQVDACQYHNVRPEDIGEARVQADTTNRGRKKPLVGLLREKLRFAPSDQKKPTLSVVREIMDDNPTFVYAQPSGSITSNEEETIYLDALEEAKDEEMLDLGECVLANNEERDYPLPIKEENIMEDAKWPVRETEAERLHAVETGGYFDIRGCQEMNVLCSIAAESLDCSVGIVTVINATEQIVMAANVDEFYEQKVRRCDTVCAHTIVDPRPMLVPHPEADVRFSQMPPIASLEYRFYFGVPVTTQDGYIIGSLAVLDKEPREVSQSQYTTMIKLAKVAKKIFAAESEARKKKNASKSTKSSSTDARVSRSK